MRWTTRCAVLLVLVGGLLSPGFAEVRLVIVDGAARVMLRSEPRIHPSTALGSVPAGTLFPFQKEADGWIQVGMADGSSAWISGRYVRLLPASAAAWIRMALAPLSPEPGADELRRLEAGRLVIVDEVRGEWARVRDSGELAGWMRLEALELLPDGPVPEVGPPSPSQPADGSSESGPESAGDLGVPEESGVPEPGTPESGTVAASPVESPQERMTAVAEQEASGGGETAAAEAAPLPGEKTGGEPGTTSREPRGFESEEEAEATAPTGQGAPDRTAYYLVAALIIVGAGLLWWWWRRRRLRDVQRFLRPGGAGERVRPAEVRRRLAELRERRDNLQRALSDKFQELKELATAELSPEGSGALSRRLGELGRVAELYERRNETLSDLLALQSEMIDLLKEENDVLRRAGGE
ncbi:MAG: hypothetical protein Kow00109_18710 [Acidobacteriota bacterium]